MSDALSAAVSIGFHGLAFAMVLYLISVGLSVTMGAAWAAENNPKSDGAPEMIIAARRNLIRQLRLGSGRVFSENAASRALLKGLGFAEIGIHRRHGRLDGLWRDCVIVERLLEAGDGEHKG